MTSPDPAGPTNVVGRALSTDSFGLQDEFTPDELALLLKTRACAERSLSSTLSFSG